MFCFLLLQVSVFVLLLAFLTWWAFVVDPDRLGYPRLIHRRAPPGSSSPVGKWWISGLVQHTSLLDVSVLSDTMWCLSLVLFVFGAFNMKKRFHMSKGASRRSFRGHAGPGSVHPMNRLGSGLPMSRGGTRL